MRRAVRRLDDLNQRLPIDGRVVFTETYVRSRLIRAARQVPTYKPVIDYFIAQPIEVWSKLTVDQVYAKLQAAQANDASLMVVRNQPKARKATDDDAVANFTKTQPQQPKKDKSKQICYDYVKEGGCKRAQCGYVHEKPKETDSKTQKPSEPVACKHCGGKHKQWNCPKRPKCEWCGKQGHVESECNNKKRGQPKALAAISQQPIDGFEAKANMIVCENASVGKLNPNPQVDVEAVCSSVRVKRPATECSPSKNNQALCVPDGMLVEKFLADTGANRTVYPNGRNAYEYCSMPIDIKTASGTCMKSDGVGKMKLYNTNLQEVCGFDNVLFCKGVTEKLASVGEMCDAGMVCVFDQDKLTTYKKDKVKIQGDFFTCDYREEKSRLYPLTLLRKKGENKSTVVAMATVREPAKAYGGRDLPEQIDVYNNGLPQTLLAKVYVKPGTSEIERYHAKFGDIGMKYLKRCMPMLKVPTQYRCEICIDGKMHKFNHKACVPGVRPVYAPGVCIHSDHSGPYTRSIGNARYSQLYLDRGSGYLWAARQSKKTDHYTDTPRIFLDAGALSGNRVQIFQTDGDGVFTANETRKILEEHKVRHEWGAPYDSDTNAHIERARRSVFEGVATALLRSGAPSGLWGEAEAHKVFTMNVLPTVEDPDKPGGYCSRKNLLQGNRCPADLEKLMAFGTQATCYIPVEARKGGKHPAQRKSFHGAIVGYEENMPAYRVWNFETGTIKVVSYNFTICHEGYYPWKDKKNWTADQMCDPEFFSPNFGGVLSQKEWEKYDFDEEERMEALNENCLFNQPRPQDPKYEQLGV